MYLLKPKSVKYTAYIIVYHPFGGTPIYGNPHICLSVFFSMECSEFEIEQTVRHWPHTGKPGKCSSSGVIPIYHSKGRLKPLPSGKPTFLTSRLKIVHV